MRRFYLISFVTTLWLLYAVNATSAVRFKELPVAPKPAATETNQSTAFSSNNVEIELTGIQLFLFAHHTIDKKEPFHSSNGYHGGVVKVNVNKGYSARLLAVNAAKSYKLLFPFHHFW